MQEIIVLFVFFQNILMTLFLEIELHFVNELCFPLELIIKKTKAI